MLHKAVVLSALMWCFVSLAHESRAQEKSPTTNLKGSNVQVHALSNGFVEVAREFVQGRLTASGACNYRVITKAGLNERPLDWQTVEEDFSTCQIVIVRGRMAPRQDEKEKILGIGTYLKSSHPGQLRIGNRTFLHEHPAIVGEQLKLAQPWKSCQIRY